MTVLLLEKEPIKGGGGGLSQHNSLGEGGVVSLIKSQ